MNKGMSEGRGKEWLKEGTRGGKGEGVNKRSEGGMYGWGIEGRDKWKG